MFSITTTFVVLARRFALLALVTVPVYLTACAAFAPPKLPYDIPAEARPFGAENCRYLVENSECCRQSLQNIALVWNQDLRVLAAAHKLALVRDEQGLAQLSGSVPGMASANYIETAIRAVVMAIQALVEAVRAKQRQEVLLELITAQWKQAVAELKGKLQSLLDELKLVRGQRAVEQQNLDTAQAELEAIDTLIHEGLFRGQPQRERADARTHVEETQRRVYALQKEEQRLENATMDLVGGYADE